MKRSKAGSSKLSKPKWASRSQKYRDACLLVLDFDHTMVDGNTDTFIWKLGENGTIPDAIKQNRSQKLWTYLMQDVFDYLHQQGRTPTDILECIASMKLAPGMDTVLFNIPENYDIIIVSDSNAVFIQHILETQGLFDRIAHIFTNTANFDNDGRLVITPFSDQDTCDICERNICKGEAMKVHVERMCGAGKIYSRVLYVGDGQNDVCPCLKLGKNDTIFARSGYKLESELKKIQHEKKQTIKAAVVIWHDASILMDYV